MLNDELLKRNQAVKMSLLTGKPADLRDTELLKNMLVSLKHDPAFEQVTQLKMAVDNSASSQALEILSAFLINVQQPIDLQLTLNNPLTIFQSTYLKKAAELNPYLKSIDIGQEITLSSTKKVWEYVQKVLSRNHEIVNEGFVKDDRLADIIHTREQAKVNDNTIEDLNFGIRKSTKNK